MQKVRGGLSPRMRGNPEFRNDVRMHIGSIPAHAGEPWGCILWADCFRVYPRACGGTSAEVEGTGLGKGLSPRMRGNHVEEQAAKGAKGSIPAHAGEPHWRSTVCSIRGVYPRACGGTRVFHRMPLPR